MQIFCHRFCFGRKFALFAVVVSGTVVIAVVVSGAVVIAVVVSGTVVIAV